MVEIKIKEANVCSCCNRQEGEAVYEIRCDHCEKVMINQKRYAFGINTNDGWIDLCSFECGLEYLKTISKQRVKFKLVIEPEKFEDFSNFINKLTISK